MIKKLRYKFIAIAMCSVVIVLGSIIGIINIINYSQINKRGDVILKVLSDNFGVFPKKLYYNKHNDIISPETLFTTRYFTVVIDEEGTIVFINTGNTAATSTTAAADYTKKVFEQKKISGFIGNYKYNRIPYYTDYMYIFLDCRQELSTFYSFLIISIVVSLIGILFVFILLLSLSKIVIRPIAESYEKQKRFITDANHEIKTPLAIIDANTEVLELEYGESEWTKSTKNQIRRLSSLTENLIFLSRMDEENHGFPMEDFSISNAVLERAKMFETIAIAQEKTLYLEIMPSVFYHGNESMICQLISILLDNAIKYSNSCGKIFLSLKRNERKVELVVRNTVDEIPKGNLDRIFDRFYRLDNSRNSETGGYGIGLSMAKAIVNTHKGKITARSDDGKEILFYILL